jgi:hypothetical protein
MFMRSTKAALLAGAVLAAVLVPAGAASAQKVAIDDSNADVWETAWDGDIKHVRVGSQPNVDLVSTVLRHGAHKLILTFKYAELSRSRTRFAAVSTLRFAEGSRIGVVLHTFARWRGHMFLTEIHSGDRLKCANLEHAIDYTADTVALTVPRSCIGDPKWVEVNSFAYGSQEDPDTGAELHNYSDNAQNAGHGYRGWSERVRTR